MSFQKAADFLCHAELANARYQGVALTETEEEFGVDRRTAQRMTKALEQIFPRCMTRVDDDRRKHWKIRGDDARLILAQGIRDSELAALELAIRRAECDDMVTEVRALSGLRDRLLATMPGPHALGAEADAQAVLEAHGFASRPGPRVRIGPDLMGVIEAGLKGPRELTIVYAGGRDQGFDLPSHAARTFGSFHTDAEYGEVIWRLSPAAGPTARDFLFHPTQEMTDEPDGSLTVHFTASGLLEMASHLYMWGGAVEVLAPEPLHGIVDRHQRSDFPALP